ncbi:dual specificity protein phosphatase family protein [Candidatus Uabimicrobium sp. HlEnr_7]|uniref:dual specificity protein phosphatase family protein n=1 Tax=Candidatus Uabimicrobium helgolandensis TaxID=3095367 RepID=UPI003557CD5A
MNIEITGVFEAVNMVNQKPNHYRVISIASKKSVTRMMVNDIKGSKELLILEFDDATPDEVPGFDFASHEDCKEALDFLSRGDNCLIHCHAGVSRSTAISLGYLLSIFDYREAVDRLFNIRPSAQPNEYVIKLMCDVLNKQHLYSDIIDYVRQK